MLLRERPGPSLRSCQYHESQYHENRYDESPYHESPYHEVSQA